MRNHLAALADYRVRLLRRLSNQHPELSAVESVRLQWFRVMNVTDPEAADVYVYDEIGGSFGVQASELVNEINGITAPQINVHINSPGGDLFDSIAIYNALAKHPANVTVYVDALAASGASIIAQAGDTRIMMRGAQMMIHDALAVLIGNAADFRTMATFLDRQSDNIADIYQARAGGSADEWRARMLAETWTFAGETVALGLADEVYEASDKPGEAAAVEDFTALEIDAMADKEFAELFTLMTKRHTTRNRGFKYVGREAAPAPQDRAPVELVSTVRNAVQGSAANNGNADAHYDRMVAVLKEGIRANA
jgi:ATP-dependent protease ClpP protease subunit